MATNTISAASPSLTLAQQEQKGKVVITRARNMIKVQPHYESLLGAVLSYRKRVRTGGDARDCKYVDVRLYRIENDYMIVPAGLTTRIFETLRKWGIAIEHVDLRELVLPEPDFTQLDLASLRPEQIDMLAACASSDRGVIEAPTGAGKSFLLRQLCKIWPTAKIIICSPVVDSLRGMRSELLEFLPAHQLGFCGDGYHDDDRRVTLAVDKSLGYCDLKGCQLFIFDEVHRASSEKNSEMILNIPYARVFGFSASPYGRSDNSDLATEALFGPTICRSTYQQVQASGSVVPIEVYFVNTGHVKNETYVKTIAMERNLLWRSRQRNQAIALAVKWAIEKYGPDTQILVMVSKVEHAVHLGTLLPDFPLVYGNMDAHDRVRWEQEKMLPEGVHPISSKTREQLYEDFRSGKLKRAISTGVWSTGVDFPALNVLIRADAGGGDIASTQIPGRVSRVSDGKTVGILIDFSDSFNENLKRRGVTRRRIYAKKGWAIQQELVLWKGG